MAIGVLLVPVPALVIGSQGLLRRTGRASTNARADRVDLVLVVTGRLIGLVLLLTLSAVTLVSCIGGLVRGLQVPSLVYVFCMLDLLIGALVLVTFGRLARRPARRRGSPARR